MRRQRAELLRRLYCSWLCTRDDDNHYSDDDNHYSDDDNHYSVLAL